ncbi:vesicle-associated membrane protein 5 [Betta splendens]|uniref:Vesicle-associated membrane protein 5 n=1 Tax=Betta splendens TaxID=158456 RepID=A0A6P7NIV8_BETSP|nr:vesicle-associated membrane protein 5 [Betta splendens]
MENGKSRLEQTQDEVEEVKVIMMNNLEKVDERSDKLMDLENRADQLLETSKHFEKTTIQVKNKQRWENKKMKVIFIIVGVVAAVLVIGVIIYFSLSSSE